MCVFWGGGVVKKIHHTEGKLRMQGFEDKLWTYFTHQRSIKKEQTEIHSTGNNNKQVYFCSQSFTAGLLLDHCCSLKALKGGSRVG